MRGRPSATGGVLWATGLVTLIFLVAPLIVVIPNAFSSGDYLVFPPPGFSLRWLEAFVQDPRWLSATSTSLEVALGATIVSVVCGTGAAVALDGWSFPGKTLFTVLLLTPLIVPVVIVAIGAYLFFLSVGLYSSLVSLMIADSLLGFPFVFVTVSSSLTQQDPRLYQAATSLGAHPIRAFREAVLPLIAPGIVAGGVLAFVMSFDDVVLANFLAGPLTITLPLKLFQEAQYELNPTLAAVSIVLLCVSLLVLALLTAIGRAESRLGATIKHI